jgi:hypothetical protein
MYQQMAPSNLMRPISFLSMQGKQEMDLSFLRSASSDAIQVVWGETPSGKYDDAYYLPNSTCTQGRNYLLQLAYSKGVARGEQYLYFIYTEDDAELDEIIDFGLSQGVREKRMEVEEGQREFLCVEIDRRTED